MGVKLVSASAGSVEIVAPTTASNYTATMPAGTGSVVVNGINGSIVSGTAVSSTSGTYIDFTAIPSWVKRVTVMFNGVSTSSTSDVICQIGSGSATTTGYSATGSNLNTSSMSSSAYTTGFPLMKSEVAASIMGGIAFLTNVTSNVWAMSANISRGDGVLSVGAGYISLGGTLDRVRITTINNTDTFDAGSINILYE